MNESSTLNGSSATVAQEIGASSVQRSAASRRGVREALAGSVVRMLLRSPALLIAGYLIAPILQRIHSSKLRGVTFVQAVDSLFGPMPRREAARIVRRVIVNSLRAVCVMGMRGVGGRASPSGITRWSSAGLRRVQDFHASGRPAILATWHLGPPLQTLVALEYLNIPATGFRTKLRGRLPHEPTASESLHVRESAEGGLVLRRAFARLRAGSFVVVVMDNRKGGTLMEASFLGRRIVVGRAAAALSRLSGAPILPVVKTWAADGTIEVHCFDAVPKPQVDRRDADAFDRALTLETVRWFENYIRSAPEQLKLKNVARLYRASRLSPPSPSDSPQTSRGRAAPTIGRATGD